MPIAACPSCRSKLNVPNHAAGMAVKCPGCARRLRIGEDASLSIDAPARSDVPSTSELPDEPIFREDDLEIVDETADEMVVEEPIVLTADPFEGQGVSDKLQQRIHDELADREKIVWVGRPSLRLAPPKIDKPLPIGIGTIVGGFILFGGAVNVLMSNTLPGGYKVAGAVLMVGASLFFLALGLLICVACFAEPLLRLFPSFRNIYVLTNRRALVCEVLWWTPHSYKSKQLARMKRKESKKVAGAGDLVFGQNRKPNNANLPRGGIDGDTEAVGFTFLENVGQIERLIRDTLLDGNPKR